MAEQHSAHESGLPQITDEAADTPMWVPVLGLFVLAALALALIYVISTGTQETPSI
ncbi:MAG: hypothetical protein H5U40_12610, partial [Polyangiaceae bacterium]|nr:hypothetical protein [Polyangiaceae bacterium]